MIFSSFLSFIFMYPTIGHGDSLCAESLLSGHRHVARELSSGFPTWAGFQAVNYKKTGSRLAKSRWLYETDIRFSANGQAYTGRMVDPGRPTGGVDGESIGRARLSEYSAKAMSLTFGAYRERRAHWGPGFIDKLSRVGAETTFASTFLFSLGDEGSGTKPEGELASLDAVQILGTLRLIEESNGVVPMETYLDLRFRSSSDQIKIEPGNFTIAPHANELASLQLSILLLSRLDQIKAVSGKDPILLTYADRFSERLYAARGYKSIPLHLLEWKQTPSSEITKSGDGVRVFRDGIWWLPMHITSRELEESLLARLEILASARSSKYWIARQLYLSLYDLRFGVKNVLEIPPTEFIGRSFAPDMPASFAKLHVNRSQVGYVTLSFEMADGHKPIHSLRVPFPLPDDYQTSFANGASLRYRRGTLEVKQLLPGYHSDRYVHSAELVIDPLLQAPEVLNICPQEIHEVVPCTQVFF